MYLITQRKCMNLQVAILIENLNGILKVILKEYTTSLAMNLIFL